MPADFPVTDLWRVLAGQLGGRDSAEQVTIFDSVGFALEDYSALRYVNEQASRLELGERIDLVPWSEDEDNDPKDLFRYTRSAKARKGLRRIA